MVFLEKIEKIKIRKILNSKKEPTVEVEVFTKKGFGKASAPSGTSVGKHEAIFKPKKINILIKNAREKIFKKLIRQNADFQNIDLLLKEIDGTNNFSNIGGCVSIATSIAVAKAAANAEKNPLYEYLNKQKEYLIPLQLGKCIGGGMHGKNGPEIQEFLITPITSTVSKTLFISKKVHEKTLQLIKRKQPAFKGKKDFEGGWVPHLDNENCLDLLSNAVEEIADQTGVKIRTGLDFAANNLYKQGHYVYREKKMSSGEQLDYILNLIRTYNLSYIEDPFQEEDFESFSELTQKAKCLICGDDLFATNKRRLEMGIEKKAGNSIIIKPNQAGTLSDTIETMKYAEKNKYVPIVSHRSGETNDTAISHIAVAFNCPLIKIGIVGKERTVKLKELMNIQKLGLKMNRW